MDQTLCKRVSASNNQRYVKDMMKRLDWSAKDVEKSLLLKCLTQTY